MDAIWLIEKAKREGTPLVDGETATFVWRGKRPPMLIGDWTHWGEGEPGSFEPLAPGVWVYRHDFPRDAYIEYVLVRGNSAVRDPFNSRLVHNGLDGYNHFFYMPEATPTPHTRSRRGFPRGTLTRHIVAAKHVVAGGQRTVHLYAPPAAGSSPLVVVLDGSDYLRQAKLATLVDNLIAEGRIRPVSMAFVDNGRKERLIEYACSEATLLFLLNGVLPLAAQELDLLDLDSHPGSFGVLGASMGGLMSLYTALRRPDIFGRVLSQSGAFTLFGQDTVVYDLVGDGPVRPVKAWLDCGGLERLVETNRRMLTLMEAKGYDARYDEHSGGHHWTAWRDHLAEGLEWLFPPEA